MYIYYDLKKVSEKEGTIRVILSQHAKKAVIYTGKKILINDWIKGNPKAIGKNANINLYLRKYKTAFDLYMTNTQLANDLPSLNNCKDFITTAIKTPTSERGKKDIPALIEQFKKEKEGILKEGALKPFTTLSNHLTDFETNIQFAGFNKDWATKFAKYLSEKSTHIKGAKSLQNPTINKMIVTLKVFCKWAFEKKHTSATEWMQIKRVKELDQRIITLTMSELITYFNFDFKEKINLERAKDVFCFASFLGLRYNDIKQVNKRNIKKGYLHINTQKTNTELRIKLIPEALEILEKYNYILPLDISNLKLNKIISITQNFYLLNLINNSIIQIKHLTIQMTIMKYKNKILIMFKLQK